MVSPVVSDIHSVMPSCEEAQTILVLKAVASFKRFMGRRRKPKKEKKKLK